MCTPIASTRIFRIVAVIILLTGTSFGGDSWVVREDAIGPIRIGISLAQLTAILHQKPIGDESGSDNCFYVHTPNQPHIGYMIIDDHVARVDVTARGIKTSTGIHVGDSETRARQLYGARLKITPHQYVDTGNYLTVQSSDGRYGIRFETDKGKITGFYAGKYDAIQYVEGCE
jgi:hypothetical protein